jgi:hypothetical protein
MLIQTAVLIGKQNAVLRQNYTSQRALMSFSRQSFIRPGRMYRAARHNEPRVRGRLHAAVRSRAADVALAQSVFSARASMVRIREHQMTSIELLEHVGLMSDTLNIGHGNFTADNPLASYSGSDDLQIMGRHQCSISHCPVNVARRARFLDNWQSYKRAARKICQCHWA